MTKIFTLALFLFRRENYAKMHRDTVKGPPPRVTSGNYCARNTIIAEPTPRYTDTSASLNDRKPQTIPRNTVLAEPTPRTQTWNRGIMPEISARLVDMNRKDDVYPVELAGSSVVSVPPKATQVAGDMKWGTNYQTTAMGRDIHASGKVLTGYTLLEQLRPPPELKPEPTFFQPKTGIARYRPDEIERAFKATQKRKPRTETKAGIPPGAVSLYCVFPVYLPSPFLKCCCPSLLALNVAGFHDVASVEPTAP